MIYKKIIKPISKTGIANYVEQNYSGVSPISVNNENKQISIDLDDYYTKNQVDNLETSINNQIQTINNNVSGIDTTIETINSELENVNNEVQTITNDLGDLGNQVNTNTNNIDSLTRRVNRLSNLIRKNFNDAAGTQEVKTYGAGQTKMVSKTVNFSIRQFGTDTFDNLTNIKLTVNNFGIDGRKYFTWSWVVLGTEWIQITILLTNSGDAGFVNEIASKAVVDFIFK